MEWRFLNTGVNTGAMNMAIDEAVLINHAEGLVPPTLRFYTWEPSAVTLGYFQSLEKEIDIQGCKQVGVDYVRRLTGGRAVLHDRDFTYSVIVVEDNPLIPKGILESYKELSRGIIRGLDLLGVKAEVVALADDTNKGKKKDLSVACFDSPSWYEVVIDGKKIVGSAQTRREGVLLQHGSILLNLDIDKLFTALKTPSEKVKERIVKDFPNRAISLDTVLGRTVVYEDLIQVMQEGFAEALGIKLLPGELTPQEVQLAKQLEQEKYASLEWNTRK